MKTQSIFCIPTLLTATALLVGSLTSCQKETVVADDPTKGFSENIQRIIPENIINDLRSRGMVINEGKVPPKIEGTFRVSPYELLSPFGPADTYKVGEIIDDYVYKFYGQNTSNQITYDYTNNGSDKGTGNGAFIAGNGSRFTIFSEDVGVSSGVSYKTVAIMSGELTTAGIRDFQYAFVLKEKSVDTDNKLIPVNTGRIWFDNDYLATSGSGGRIASSVQKSANVVSTGPNAK